MAPTAIAIQMFPTMVVFPSVLIGLAAATTLILVVIMCCCGDKKDEQPPAEPKSDDPSQHASMGTGPAPYMETGPCPAYTAVFDKRGSGPPPPAEPPSKKSDKEELKEPKELKDPNKSIRDASLIMREAKDLQLMSKIEGPAGVGDGSMRSKKSVKVDQPSLRLMGSSVIAGPSGKSFSGGIPASQSSGPGPQEKSLVFKSVSVADRSISIGGQSKSIIVSKKK